MATGTSPKVSCEHCFLSGSFDHASRSLFLAVAIYFLVIGASWGGLCGYRGTARFPPPCLADLYARFCAAERSRSLGAWRLLLRVKTKRTKDGGGHNATALTSGTPGRSGLRSDLHFRRFRYPHRPLERAPVLPNLYGSNFRHSQHLARLRRLGNGETVSATDSSPENGLGRGSGEIGPGETGQAKTARTGAAAGGARALWVRTSARHQAPASPPDAASLLCRRLLHTGYARDAQPWHLLPQVSARACWYA